MNNKNKNKNKNKNDNILAMSVKSDDHWRQSSSLSEFYKLRDFRITLSIVYNRSSFDVIIHTNLIDIPPSLPFLHPPLYPTCRTYFIFSLYSIDRYWNSFGVSRTGFHIFNPGNVFIAVPHPPPLEFSPPKCPFCNCIIQS